MESGRLNHPGSLEIVESNTLGMLYTQYIACISELLFFPPSSPFFFDSFIIIIIIILSIPKRHTGKMGLFNYLLTG